MKKLNFGEVRSFIENENYILHSTSYKNNKQKLKIECNKGHIYYVNFTNFKSGKRCPICYMNSPLYNSYVIKNNIALYDTYVSQLEWIEDTRRDPENNDLLQVRCTKCDNWFTPNRRDVNHRIQRLKNGTNGSRFYCSNECKNNCSIFNRTKYQKGFTKNIVNSRELQPELKELVFQRDGYECQRCGNDTDLHCHHFEGIEQNPIESADIDNCITLCKECHELAHFEIGCRYVDLRKGFNC